MVIFFSRENDEEPRKKLTLQLDDLPKKNLKFELCIYSGMKGVSRKK